MKILLLVIGLIFSGCSTLPNDTLGLTVNEWRERTFAERLVSREKKGEIWYSDASGFAPARLYYFKDNKLVKIERRKITREELEAKRLKAEMYRSNRPSRTDVYIHQGQPLFTPQPLN